jgi:Acyl-CoA carboxylase epsilon subunit
VSEFTSEPSNTVSEFTSEPSNTMSEFTSEPSNTVSDRPVLRIIRGGPTDEEIAALVGALAVIRRPTPVPPSPRSAWSMRASQLRSGQLQAGPNAWYHSALPR